MKVGAENTERISLEIERIQKEHIYHIKGYQRFFRKSSVTC